MKCIYICSRRNFSDSVEAKLIQICNELSPDNIISVDPLVCIYSDVAYGVVNPNSTLLIKGNSLMLGKIIVNGDEWSKPLVEYPDGTFALFRSDAFTCEILTDAVASRTIWYYFDENHLVASTSQRAIIKYLGSFRFDERVIPWMLSTGTMGPGFSWDTRINRIPPDTSVILDKKNWSLAVKSTPIIFHSVKRTEEEFELLLNDSIQSTFTSLNLDFKKWALPLSGGYDSRGILCFLKSAPDFSSLKTITWGLISARGIKGNDAYVARKLAENMNVANKYFGNDLSDESLNKIIDRFVAMGEGRIDNFADYLDGFKTWKMIYEEGIEGIIRGDEGFGCHHYWSDITISLNQSLNLCTDIANLKDYRKYGFSEQKIPLYLKRKKGESLSTWRDRLFHAHTIPTVFAALSDLKLAFVEQVNPFLFKKILLEVRQQPDKLRTEKFLFKKIVDSLSPNIDYATASSSASLRKIFRTKDIANLLLTELTSDVAKHIFPGSFLDYLIMNLNYNDHTITTEVRSSSFLSLIKRIIPRSFKNIMQKMILPQVDFNILAFRVLMICRMYKILSSYEKPIL